jgi:uncharacterized RDD family membrane protein YckC
MNHVRAAETGRVYALQARMFACVVDTLVWAAVVVPTAVATGDVALTGGAIAVVSTLRALCTWRFGGTPAKRLFQVSVVSHSTGARLGLGHSFLREILVLPHLVLLSGLATEQAFLVLVPWLLLDVAVLSVRSDRRSLHDLLAGSAVLDSYR